MGLHDHGSRRSHLLGYVIPGRIEQPRARTLTPLEGGDELLLALHSMLEVLAYLRVRIGYEWPVTRTDQLEVEFGDAAERLKVCDE